MIEFQPLFDKKNTFCIIIVLLIFIYAKTSEKHFGQHFASANYAERPVCFCS